MTRNMRIQTQRAVFARARLCRAFPLGLFARSLGTVLTLLLATGCSKKILDNPTLLPVKNFDVNYAQQPNTIESKFTNVEHGLDLVDIQFRKVRIAIYKVNPHKDVPTTQDYFGANCDQFYLNGTGLVNDEPQTKCGQGIEYLEEEFAARYRADFVNGDTFHKYHILLIAQPVKFGTGVASGNIIGLKSPRIDDDTSPKLCAYIFDRQMRAWMDTLYPSRCGYSSGGRRDYVQMLVDWIVGHELGREIGDLHSFDDMNAQWEHNQAPAQQQADYMRNLTDCDPVTYTNNPLKSIFCSDTDTIPTNSCRDLLKRKFNIP